MSLTASSRVSAYTDKIWDVPKKNRKKRKRKTGIIQTSFYHNAKMCPTGFRLITEDLQQKRQAELVSLDGRDRKHKTICLSKSDLVSIDSQ